MVRRKCEVTCRVLPKVKNLFRFDGLRDGDICSIAKFFSSEYDDSIYVMVQKELRITYSDDVKCVLVNPRYVDCPYALYRWFGSYAVLGGQTISQCMENLFLCICHSYGLSGQNPFDIWLVETNPSCSK